MRRKEGNLTPRELEILLLFADGLTAVKIADQLVISRKTVNFHALNLIAKLGQRNMLFAVVTADRLGLIDLRG